MSNGLVCCSERQQPCNAAAAKKALRCVQAAGGSRGCSCDEFFFACRLHCDCGAWLHALTTSIVAQSWVG